MISPGVFSVFQILIFWVVWGVKGQKMVQSDKKICLLHSISERSYIILLSFMANIFKMIISSSVFFQFFKILIFWVHREGGGGSKGKKRSIMTKNSVRNLRNYTSHDCGFWCTCGKWWYLQQFFSFFKILIFGVFRG